jgi:hypothetical protein
VATFLPTSSLSPLWNFVQFSSTVSALETALRSAFPDQNVQVYADDQTSGNALVVADQRTVFSVPPGSYVGWNGSWAQYPAAKMAGGASSLFTAYPPS